MKNDGGKAFPTVDTFEDGGVTMRDYFAAAAMEGELAAQINPGITYDKDAGRENLAKWSYQMADTMLAEREREIKE